MCPHCKQNAPSVHRGVLAYCTACGKPRAPFSSTAVNLVGRPSRVGGTMASVMGWVILVGGLMVALALGLLLQAIWPAGFAGWGIGVMIALVAGAAGGGLLYGGKNLHRSGTHAAASAREQAVFALAAHRGGTLTAAEVARAIGAPVEEADAFLTELVNRGDEVTLDVSDDGALSYRFTKVLPEMKQRWPVDGPLRVKDAAEGAELLEAQVEPPRRAETR